MVAPEAGSMSPFHLISRSSKKKIFKTEEKGQPSPSPPSVSGLFPSLNRQLTRGVWPRGGDSGIVATSFSHVVTAADHLASGNAIRAYDGAIRACGGDPKNTESLLIGGFSLITGG
ncbi:hypothetical protein COCNU_12G004600 [Cocos nucifera]|uniref:Uncharacterized protein n=1 Tax=Cocos nucifera TaxID=13894 RepID=A0A8K0IR33_COCNU|nr:hypothetical protein COCNU_12G004600 [Cocos nucifera]